jgi:beta-galactosidase
LHKGAGGTYVWVVNPTRTTKTVTLTLPENYQRAKDLWQESSHPSVNGAKLTVSVEDRNAAVVRLE